MFYEPLPSVGAGFEAYEPIEHSPGRMDALLSTIPGGFSTSGGVYEVSSTIDLPYAGEVRLSIVRTTAEDARTMDFLELSLRRIEEFMGWPFPDRHIIYYMHDGLEDGTFSYFYGTHVQITMDDRGERGLYYPRIVEWGEQPLLESASGERYRSQDVMQSATTCVDADGRSWTCAEARTVDGQSHALAVALSGPVVMAHEAIHYYFAGRSDSWGSHEQWLVEGATTFLTYLLMEHLYPEYPFPGLNEFYTASALSPCVVSTLAEAEQLEGFERLDCMYLLGAQLFEDLHQAMDEMAFRLAFRRAFLHTWVDGPACDADRTTVCHVREAFVRHASDATVVEGIIDRWHGGA